MKSRFSISPLLCLMPLCIALASCGAQKKLSELNEKGPEKDIISLAPTKMTMPDVTIPKITRDTLTVMDDSGTEMIIMKATRDDEDGEMVANDVLDAAIVTASFRNIAERQGKINLAFQIVVPSSMQDKKWQLRFYPDMYYLEDSIRLEPVIITGEEYRATQLKGYQRYQRFIDTIVQDSTVFINFDLLEIFLKRNISELYAFRSDTTVVSEEEFRSVFGISERQAVEHYTNTHAVKMNDRRKSKRQKMYERFVKSPIVTEGIRLDTIIQSADGDFIYNYVQTINTQPKLKKVDIVLSGEIFEQEKLLYTIPRNKPITFYVSSLSEFTEYKEKYLKQVVERQAEANTTSYVEFETGKSRVVENLGNNPEEIGRIKEYLSDLMGNAVFDLDSIVVSAFASPEGSVTLNNRLSKDRSDAISRYFNSYMDECQEELEYERGFSVDEGGNIVKEKKVEIPFISRSYGENWDMLDFLVNSDKELTEEDKSDYFSLKEIKSLDDREKAMRSKPYYKRLVDRHYPKLRTVRFNFFLHRKGMVKDTVESTVVDEVYQKGIDALKDKDYETALKYLGPYGDFNSAVAYVAMDRNASAMIILNSLEKTADVNYLLAIIYSRMGDPENAVKCYLKAVKEKPTYVHRGNLDPEISILIQTYNLNSYGEEEDFEYSF